MDTTLQTILQKLETYCEAQKWTAVISTCEHLMNYASEQCSLSAPLDGALLEESRMYRIKGLFLEAKGDLEGAVSAYQKAILLNPLDDGAYQSLVNLYRQQEQWEKVANTYQQALQINPNQLEFASQLLEVLDQATDVSLAVEVLNKAFLSNPDVFSAENHFTLGHYLNHEGKIDAAIRCYRQAIAQNPQHVDSLVQLANSLRQIKEHPAAMNIYQQALNLRPKSDIIYYELGCCLQQQSKFNDACIYFKKAIEFNPKSATSYVELSKIWHQQGLIEKAVRTCLKALNIDPNLTEAYIKLRYNLLRYDIQPTSSLLEEVSNQCQVILKKNPDSLRLQSLLGYTLTIKGDCEQAIHYYQKASEKQAHLFCKNILEEQWQSTQIKTPHFIIIGAFKCATTSLYQYINRHPNILPALEKELDFFDRQFDNGLNWYQSHFPPVPSEGDYITGEATPNYFYGLQTPNRIIQNLPNIKLILILRNPIDRTVSHYKFLQVNRQKHKPIEEVLELELERLVDSKPEDEPDWKIYDRNCYIAHSLYFHYLQYWLKYISRDQLLIIKHEDLANFPEKTLSKTFKYLDLPDYRLSEYRKYKAGHYEPISSEMRHKLSDFFVPHVHALEKLLDMKFEWDLG